MKFLIAVAILTSQAALAGAPQKAAVCIACHGENGISPNSLWPNLARQKADYMVKQLKAFQSGERKDPLMSPIAATIDQSELEELAQYFAKLK